MMRSIVRFGAPIFYDGVRYNDITDNFANQSTVVHEFQTKIIEDFTALNDEHEDKGTHLMVHYFS